jgi:hypothetical protein
MGWTIVQYRPPESGLILILVRAGPEEVDQFELTGGIIWRSYSTDSEMGYL